MSSSANLVLIAGLYSDNASVAYDYAALRSADGTDDEFTIEGSIVVSKDSDGKIDVKETGGGQIDGGSLVGLGVGAFIGLFAPPFLLASAIGAGIGAITGKLSKNHEEDRFGVDLDRYLDDNTSAILVIVEDQYVDGVESALSRADGQVSRAVGRGDYDDIVEAVSKGASETRQDH